jgi:hypothetical protein
VLLRIRLQRRGVVLSAGLLTAALAERAEAAVPEALVLAAFQAASFAAAGKTATALEISGQAIAWAEAALQSMGTTKMKIVLTIGGIDSICAAVPSSFPGKRGKYRG